GTRRAGAAGEAEPVHLADHGIAGDAAQGAGDLAGRQALGPEILELFDAVVGPVQQLGHETGSLMASATRYRTPRITTYKACGRAATPCPQQAAQGNQWVCASIQADR